MSDRDRIFTSLLWEELWRLLETQLRRSTTYHPQIDGPTEVVNRGVEMYLGCFSMNTPKQWVKWLAWAELSYNTTVRTATLMTPFEALYGQPPPSILPYVKGSSRVNDEVDHLMKERDEILGVLKANLLKAQQRMVKYANAKRREVQFEVHDWVYVKLRPYRQSSLSRFKHSKLAPRFIGSFMIVARIRFVAYRLALPKESLIHPVFHVSVLRKVVGSNRPLFPISKDLAADLSMQVSPVEVLGVRKTIEKEDNLEVLIRSSEGTLESATWEQAALIQESVS